MSEAYFNENDPQMAAWLRELMADDLIPRGTVDERDIRDITLADLAGYDHVHLFAGIGGWPYALRLAGWPDDRAIWTGSCPCQPFSVSGNRGGTKDERHLWPAFRWLVAQCRPPVAFGEQVASPDGRNWLAGVRSDLEVMGYRVGAADLCAAGVGAPHIRQRLWWVADTPTDRLQRGKYEARGKRFEGHTSISAARGSAWPSDWSESVWWPCRDGLARRVPARRRCNATDVDGRCRERRTKEDIGPRCKRWRRPAGSGGDVPLAQHGWLEIEPALFPLAYGRPERVGLLRGAGNAIVPQVAAEFIRAYMETSDE